MDKPTPITIDVDKGLAHALHILTQSRLKEVLTYCERTGVFTWNDRRSTRVKAGDVAGAKNNHGYIHIPIDKRLYKAHRLAFLYVDGSLPPDCVDHIDHDRQNNAWANLRLSTKKANNKNRAGNKNNKSGYTGVCLTRGGKWQASMKDNGKQVHLGLFTCVHEAGRVVKEARRSAGYSDSHGVFLNID